MQSGLLTAVSTLSLAVLLVVIGYETDLRLIRRLGRPALSVSTGSLTLPLAAGLGLGALLPAALLGGHHGRGLFAVFIALAVAISSLPVIAKIVTGLGLARRNFGQLCLAVGTINDSVGFLALAVASGLATSVSFVALGRSLLSLALLLAAILLLGQRLVDAVLRLIRRQDPDAVDPGAAGSLAVCVVTAFVAAAAMQAVGVEGVLGAFVAGVVLGRSRFAQPGTFARLEGMSSAVFAPLFFATAGLRVDLGVLGRPVVLGSFLVMLAVATSSKFAGSIAGALWGRLPGREALALGIGLNGRGALQVVIGTAGLTTGIFNVTTYSVVILMSLVSSVAAPVLLRRVVGGWEGTTEERERLEKERELASNVVVRGERLLLPSTGGPGSVLAAQMLHCAWPLESEVTILSIHPGDGATPPNVSPALSVFDRRSVETRRLSSDTVLEGILDEVRLGYGAIGVGAADEPAPGHLLSPVVDDLLVRSPVPLIVVRRGRQAKDPAQPGFTRLLVPVSGGAASRAAQEVGFNVSRKLDSEVLLTHVVPHSSPDRGRSEDGEDGRADPSRSRNEMGKAVVEQAETMASGLEATLTATIRRGASASDEILSAAESTGADLIVLGTTVHMAGGNPFLGHTAEQVLENAEPTVAVVVLPDTGRR